MERTHNTTPTLNDMATTTSETASYLLAVLGAGFLSLTSTLFWIHQYAPHLSRAYLTLNTLLFIAISIANYRNLISYSQYIIKKNIASLDTWIILSTVIYFILQGKINHYGLVFLLLFIQISAIALNSKQQHSQKKIVFLALFLSGIFATMGVALGLIEHFYFHSTYLYSAIDFSKYPNPITLNPYHFSGMQLSYNYTAILIMSALGIINFIPLHSSQKKITIGIFFIALILTTAKVIYLFIALLTLLKIRHRTPHRLNNFFLVIAILGFILLSHITFSTNHSHLQQSQYYKDVLFSVFNIDWHASLFTWLKTQFFLYITSHSFFKASVADYQQFTLGSAPHCLYCSSYLFGGVSLSILLIGKIINNIKIFFKCLPHIDHYFLALTLTLLTESLVWDAGTCPAFWIILLFCPAYRLFPAHKPLYHRHGQ